jgi:hypothetical protein
VVLDPRLPMEQRARHHSCLAPSTPLGLVLGVPIGPSRVSCVLSGLHGRWRPVVHGRTVSSSGDRNARSALVVDDGPLWSAVRGTARARSEVLGEGSGHLLGRHGGGLGRLDHSGTSQMLMCHESAVLNPVLREPKAVRLSRRVCLNMTDANRYGSSFGAMVQWHSRQWRLRQAQVERCMGSGLRECVGWCRNGVPSFAGVADSLPYRHRTLCSGSVLSSNQPAVQRPVRVLPPGARVGQ